jgi:hypothetical protein
MQAGVQANQAASKAPRRLATDLPAITGICLPAEILSSCNCHPLLVLGLSQRPSSVGGVAAWAFARRLRSGGDAWAGWS